LAATTRRRVIPFKGIVGGKTHTVDYLDVPPFTRDNGWKDGPRGSDVDWKSLNGTQVTVSVSHPEWKFHNHAKFHYQNDRGGPFTTQKTYAEGSLFPQRLDGDSNGSVKPYTHYTYVGPLLPMAPTDFVWPKFNNSSEDNLNELGSIAISRCSPSNPTADATVFLGELIGEGLPKLIDTGLKDLAQLTHRQRRKAIGKQYLNYQFGWLPFISDLQSIANAIIHADSVLKQYERGSGRMTRRRYEFPIFEDTQTTTVQTGRSPWGPGSGALLSSSPDRGKVVRTDYQYRKVWFSGAFTYYIPPPDSIRDEMARKVIFARKLLGLTLTPDALWNLAPWSWMVDWFFDSGSVLQNWSDWAIDNQVLLYGYVMEHSVHSYTYTYIGPTGFKSGGVVPDIKLVAETKLRRQATPYGFGVNLKTLSSRQIAILAALGLSRS
jgi:hypothetical protein